ncbi:MAG: RagB/SusD family nutrient uptake outer membrane protein [Cyclobacteriaceae bacterium]|nr:RagB/SusD family nutrient uptake outer membrane protein [Cyclobacteriaceae bacterium]
MKSLKILIIAGVFSIAACDTLEQLPVSIISESNFYQNESDAEAAILGVYDRLQGFISNNFIIPISARADETDVIRGGNWTRDESFSTTSNDGHVRNTWDDLYAAIGRANDVLANVPGILDDNFTDEEKNKILGEAYFIRGFAHFHLVIRFGKVPYISEAFISPNQDYQPARDDIATVYANIIEDLKMAKQLMPADPSLKVRANKWAAAGMLAKVYMQRNNTGDRDLALTEINEVLNSQGYSLLPSSNYSDLFRPDRQKTVETIFELSYGPAGLDDAAFDNEFVSTQNFRLQPEMKIINAFKADSALVVESGKEEVRMAAALEFYYPIFNESGTCILACNPRNEYFIDKFTKDDWKKTSERAQLHPSVIILRLADLILLKAEILNEKDDLAGARTLLNEIRERVNLPETTATNKDEMRLAIENERYLELAFEGHRYWDLIRTNRAVEVIKNKGQFVPTQEKLLWPVPQADIDQNPNLLPQNQGY